MDDDDVGCLFWALVIIAPIVWFGGLDDSEIRYEYQYEVDKVVIDDKPRDCDFLTAPLGKKNCSYQKELLFARFSKDKQAGRPIIPYDEGKTWTLNTGGPTSGEGVHVYWVRTGD